MARGDPGALAHDLADSERIEGVQAPRAAYGKRGSLIGAIERLLKAQVPGHVSAEMLVMLLLSVEFNLQFDTRKDLSRWSKNVVGRALRKLVDRGWSGSRTPTGVRQAG